MLSAEELRILSASRWHVPVLAAMAGGGARFSQLVNSLGVSRSALSNCLSELQERGWIARNPGHGHPLRPEYVLTHEGEPIAAGSDRIMAERRKLKLEPADLPRWSLPIVARLNAEPARFSTLQTELRPITPRALSLTLKQMRTVELIEQRPDEAMPPILLYGLTRRGYDFAEALLAA